MQCSHPPSREASDGQARISDLDQFPPKADRAYARQRIKMKMNCFAQCAPTRNRTLINCLKGNCFTTKLWEHTKHNANHSFSFLMSEPSDEAKPHKVTALPLSYGSSVN